MNDYQDVIDELESMDGVKSVRDGSTGRVKAVDFKLFEMSRPTDASNFVFGRYGMSYKNGLIRLPRVHKDDFTADELEEKILRAISSPARECVDIRFEPEVELDDDYHYPHLEINGDIYESVHIVELIAENYRPPIEQDN